MDRKHHYNFSHEILYFQEDGFEHYKGGFSLVCLYPWYWVWPHKTITIGLLLQLFHFKTKDQRFVLNNCSCSFKHFSCSGTHGGCILTLLHHCVHVCVSCEAEGPCLVLLPCRPLWRREAISLLRWPHTLHGSKAESPKTYYKI